MKTIGAAKFKAQCLALMEQLEPEGLVITKHGEPVARIIPIPRKPADMIGSLQDEIEINGDILSTGLTWDANAKP